MNTPRPQPSPTQRRLTRAAVQRAISLLQRRVEEIAALDPHEIDFDDERVATIEANVRAAIDQVFGGDSAQFAQFGNFKIRKGNDRRKDSRYDRQRRFAEGIPDWVARLQTLIAGLDERLDGGIPSSPARSASMARSPARNSRRVFLVHGRDDAAKETVARFLEKLGLKPIVLHEQPSQGLTIIEKFERHARVMFAVVVLTPDDEGHLKGQAKEARPRARQNVIFELGYFIGRLGRRNVCALHQPGVELPSDFAGVVYVEMTDAQGWRLTLAQEIQAAGIRVDLNRAVSR